MNSVTMAYLVLHVPSQPVSTPTQSWSSSQNDGCYWTDRDSSTPQPFARPSQQLPSLCMHWLCNLLDEATWTNETAGHCVGHLVVCRRSWWHLRPEKCSQSVHSCTPVDSRHSCWSGRGCALPLICLMGRWLVRCVGVDLASAGSHCRCHSTQLSHCDPGSSYCYQWYSYTWPSSIRKNSRAL